MSLFCNCNEREERWRKIQEERQKELARLEFRANEYATMLSNEQAKNRALKEEQASQDRLVEHWKSKTERLEKHCQDYAHELREMKALLEQQKKERDQLVAINNEIAANLDRIIRYNEALRVNR